MMLSQEWLGLLSSEAQAKATELYHKAEQEQGVCPPVEQVFRAFELTPPDKVRCVIVGQDPYHTPSVANGLAFSVNEGAKFQPSLRNIFKELNSDIGCLIPRSGDLTPWAERGVLLLNTSLTVKEHEPMSHKKWHWDIVTHDVLRVCMELDQPVVFMLWGGYAHKFAEDDVPVEGKLIIKSSHPSPLGATKGNAEIPAFIGSRPFSRANKFLTDNGAEPIDWHLP